MCSDILRCDYCITPPRPWSGRAKKLHFRSLCAGAACKNFSLSQIKQERERKRKKETRAHAWAQVCMCFLNGKERKNSIPSALSSCKCSQCIIIRRVADKTGRGKWNVSRKMDFLRILCAPVWNLWIWISIVVALALSLAVCVNQLYSPPVVAHEQKALWKWEENMGWIRDEKCYCEA